MQAHFKRKFMRLPAVIGALAMLLSAGFVASSNRITANADPVASDRALSAVSLNMAKETDSNKVVQAIRTAQRLRDADLYLFQEVSDQSGKPSVADEAARKLGYSAAFAAAAPGVHDQGLAIVSRYPITRVQIKRLKTCDLRFRSRNRFSLAASVRTPWGDLRVWNVHLDTRVNSRERLDQLQPVIDDAARCAGPRLIGGDFNTNDLYWLGNVLPLPFGPAHSTAIRGAMKQHGFETPFADGLDTFPPFRRHLDWIFLSGLRALDSSVEPARFSDHNAIWVRARLQ
jgi:endonuclease/exonuclease/phosphatase family metal-dependent hydrolase